MGVDPLLVGHVEIPSGIDLDEYICALCWTRYDTPGELAEHEQAEHDTTYPIDGID